MLVGLWAGLTFTWVGWHRPGQRLIVSVAVIYLAVATVPLGLWLTTFLENRFPILSELPKAADGMTLVTV